MSRIITYSIEEILSYKNVNVNILTEELSNTFDSINSSFLQSTQYLENRKKINYNHLNSNKWKKINSNINTKLLSLLNKITDETFSSILEKVLNSNITNDGQISKLANDLMYKILTDTDNNKLYCSIVKQIIDSGLWYFKSEEREFVNFRIFFIKKLQDEFEESMNSINLLAEKYYSDEDEYFSIKKKVSSLISTIINLHLSNILSSEIMNYTVDTLKEKYSEKTPDVIEYLCKINEVHNYEDVEIFLKSLLDKDISARYKFMIEDLGKKPVKVIKKVDSLVEYKKFLTDTNLDSLKKHLNGKIDYLDLLKFVFDKIVSINLSEIDKYINMIRKIKEKMNKAEYDTFLEENLDDIISELPILSKYKEKII